MFFLTTLCRVFKRPRVFSTASAFFMSLIFIQVIASCPVSISSKLFACFFFQDFSLYSYISNNPATSNHPFFMSPLFYNNFPIPPFSTRQNLSVLLLTEFQTRPKQYFL